MSDNELDNLFKEAADGFTPPQDESAWKQMASKLDQHPVGTTSFWNWKTISTLTVTGVISITAVWYATTGNQEQISKTNEHESTNSTQNVVQEQKEQTNPTGKQNFTPAQSVEDKSDGAHAVDQAEPKHDKSQSAVAQQSSGKESNKSQTKNNNRANDKTANSNQIAASKSQTTTTKQSSGKENDNDQILNSNQEINQTANDNLIAASGRAAIPQQSSGKENDKSEVVNSSQVNNQVANNPQATENNEETTITQQSSGKENDDSQVVNSNQGSNGGQTVSSIQITNKNLVANLIAVTIAQSSGTGSNSNGIASTNDHSKGSSEKAVVGVLTTDESTRGVVAATNSTETSNASKSSPSVTQTRVKERVLVAVDSVKPIISELSEVNADSAAHDSKVTDKKDKKVKQAGVVSLKAAISPDYSSINFFSAGKTGINYGLLVGYSFNNRWSVYSGVISSKKLYDTKDVEGSYTTYNWNGHDYPVKELDGDCRILDIPINVYYTFFPERSFSLRAGLGFSSYIMRKETYVYCVDNYGTDAYYAQQVIGKNNEWFKVMNLSIAVSKKITNRWSAEFEPFVKAPLTGVGEGKVSLVSMGAFINLKFDLTKNE